MNEIITLGIDQLLYSKFKTHNECDDELYYYLNKPSGCLWGSTYTPEDKYVSDWERFADRECFASYDHGVLYTLNNSARIYTINTLHDWITLLEKYPLPDPIHNRHINLYFGCKVYLNFPLLIKDYDVIHLTKEGSAMLHLLWGNVPEISVDGKMYKISDLNAWDVESWLIMNFHAIDLDSCRIWKRDESKSVETVTESH